jgi:F0F1-type ATP synthase assembly protein I
MAGNQTPKRPEAEGANLGWVAVGYLLGGMAVWGVIGWLIDRAVHTHGVITGIGILLGAAGGIYLVFRRLGGGGK